MKSKFWVLITFAAAILVSGCTRSAAIPLVGTATSANPTANANTVKGLNALELAGTQTAVAKGTSNPAMPTLAVTGTPGTQVAHSADFPTPTSMVGTDPTATSAGTGNQAVATATSPSQQAEATALPTNPPAATSAPVANPGTYVIQFGEFPYCLARRFDVNPDDLLAVNGLADGQNLQPGTALKIPASGSFPGARSLMPHPSTWIVDPGDTIYSIACAYGDVNPLSIAAANGLTGDYALTVGAVLKIP